MSDFNTKFAKWQFKGDLAQRRKLYRKLATLLQNGTRIDLAVEDLLMRYERKGKNHPFTICLNAWLRDLKSPVKFSQAIMGWVPDDEQLFLTAGDTNLTDTLVMVVEMLGAKQGMKSVIISGFALPITYLIISIVIMLFFSFLLIPEFLRVAPEGAQFSGLAGAVQVTSNFVRDWILIILIVLISTILLIYFTLPTWTGPMRPHFDKIFPWSIYRVQTGFSWLLAVSTLTSQGFKIYDAMDLLIQNANPWLEQRLTAIWISQGGAAAFGEALLNSKYKFPDEEILDDIAVYSTGGNLDEALQIVAEEWQEESLEKIKLLFKIFGYFAMGFMVIVIVFSYAGVQAIPAEITRMLKERF